MDSTSTREGAEQTIRALLFDVGNVLVEVDFGRVVRSWAAAAGADPRLLMERFSFDEAYEKHERGEIDAPSYFDALAGTLGIDLDERSWVIGWNAVFVGEMAGIRPVLERARQSWPIYAFSNTNRVHHAEWGGRFANLLRPMEKVFVSCELGHRKPERQAYERVARELALTPGEIMFFDDSLENVRGARETGMRAVQIHSVGDIERALERVTGKLGPPKAGCE